MADRASHHIISDTAVRIVDKCTGGKNISAMAADNIISTNLAMAIRAVILIIARGIGGERAVDIHMIDAGTCGGFSAVIGRAAAAGNKITVDDAANSSGDLNAGAVRKIDGNSAH